MLASCFGSGLLPRLLWGTDRGAGTIGAVIVVGPLVLLGSIGWWAQLTAAVALTGLAAWVTMPFVEHGDPQWINIDEVAGTAVSVIGLGSWFWGPAFMVFRLADATKWPPGVAAAERLPGVLGLIGDDVVAGLWALGFGWVLQTLLA